MFNLFEQESQKRFSQGISDSEINSSSENQQRMFLKHTTTHSIHGLQEAAEDPLDDFTSGHGGWNISVLWEGIIVEKAVCLSASVYGMKVMS